MLILPGFGHRQGVPGSAGIPAGNPLCGGDRTSREKCKRSRSIDCEIIGYSCDFFARKGRDTSRSGTRSLASVPFLLRFFEVVKVCGRYLPVNGYGKITPSRPVSRVLSKGLSPRDGHSSGTHVAVRLKRPTRKRRGPRHSFPIWTCSRWGLTSRRVATALVRSYRTFSPLPATPCGAT
jgi:hypothetical protein